MKPSGACASSNSRPDRRTPLQPKPHYPMKPIRTCLAFIPALLAVCTADTLPEHAREQIGVTVTYDPAYVSLPYPGGDVAQDRGVCTDVVIRAMRRKGLDLQKAVHEDMKANFSRYPRQWGLKRPDKNIDHRRVPNLMTFMSRRGWSLPVTKNPADYLPGDIITCTVPPNLPHIAIVSDRKNAEGTPLIIHNIGSGTQEEDMLFTFPLTGHYRPSWSK